MNTDAVAVLLAGSGLLAELAGIALVGFEIRQDRRRARQLLEGEAGRFAVGSSLTVSYRIDGREPSVSERLDRLEEQVADLRAVEGRLISAYQDEIAKRLGALVRFLNQQLSGGIGRRALGAGLFVLGALLSAAANVLGTMA